MQVTLHDVRRKCFTSHTRQTKLKKKNRITQFRMKKSKPEMATEQSMTQEIMQAGIETAKAVIKAVKEVDNLDKMPDHYMQCLDQVV